MKSICALYQSLSKKDLVDRLSKFEHEKLCMCKARFVERNEARMLVMVNHPKVTEDVVMEIYESVVSPEYLMIEFVVEEDMDHREVHPFVDGTAMGRPTAVFYKK